MSKPHYPTRTDARLTSGFGERKHPVTGRSKSFHAGIDLAPKKAGTRGVPVYAVADGVARQVGYAGNSGNRLYVVHSSDRFTSCYLHLEKILVKEGQRVTRGQKIGVMGATGRATGIHLHFGISTKYPADWSRNGSFINPIPYLNGDLTIDTVQQNKGNYTVKKGDTLSGIAKRFNVKVDDLVKWNGIKDKNLIRIGQVLQVNGHGSTFVNVKKGDTVSGFANKYGSTISQIKNWNNLKDVNMIRVGQRLRVK